MKRSLYVLEITYPRFDGEGKPSINTKTYFSKDNGKMTKSLKNEIEGLNWHISNQIIKGSPLVPSIKVYRYNIEDVKIITDIVEEYQ